MILFLHNRYRTTGGEERVVDDLLWLVREQLGEDAELLERDSAQLGRGRAAVALLRGGLDPDDVAKAVRRTGARVVHAHNLNPAFGVRALRAAREAGARAVAVATGFADPETLRASEPDAYLEDFGDTAAAVAAITGAI